MRSFEIPNASAFTEAGGSASYNSAQANFIAYGSSGVIGNDWTILKITFTVNNVSEPTALMISVKDDDDYTLIDTEENPINAVIEVGVTDISLNKSSVTLKEGESETLTATVSPGNATDKTVSWSSSDENIVTVVNGLVNAVKEGTATITATAGGKIATAQVTVNPIPKEQTITASDVTEVYGGSGAIGATTNGDGQLTYQITSGSDVIDVAADGTITPKKVGTANVKVKASATAHYLEATKEVKVTVEPKKVTAPEAAVGEFTYNGKAQTYDLPAGEDYFIACNVQTNAGRYTATATLKDASNTQWTDGTTEAKEYAYTIKKASLTLTADNKKAKVGADVPELTYTMKGLAEGDKLTTEPTLAYDGHRKRGPGYHSIRYYC